MKTLIALLKRELLEHKSIWKVPVALLVIGLLIKLSMSAGNLAINTEVPGFLQLDETIDSVVDSAIVKGLGVIKSLTIFVMMLVSIFYALACLYNERQDESVLFWRSLPISDAMTMASKLLIALVLIPAIIIVCHVILAFMFVGLESTSYMIESIVASVVNVSTMTAWALLPAVAWCMLCSEIANKTPFLLAVIAPIMAMTVNKLFLDNPINDIILDRFFDKGQDSIMLLVVGLIFAIACLVFTTIKRSQRI